MEGLHPRQMQKLSEQQNEHSHLASFSSEMLQSITQLGVYSSPSQGQTKLGRIGSGFAGLEGLRLGSLYGQPRAVLSLH